jgi:nucleoside-diphosphate-sugar epimerase
MEKVLITGATGFIAGKLLKRLTDDYEVHTLERYVTGRYALDKSDKAVIHYANLTDYSAVKEIVSEVQPDYCIHLGALSAVSFSYDHYVEVTQANYIGTINLAESCHRYVPNFKQFIFAGTSEEYGTTSLTKKDILKEESALSPNSPYAVAKVASDMYLKYMHIAYDFPVTILRPFNTYGRTDNKHFFIERTITQMLSNGEVHLGDPAAVRDWLYVDDHVDAYLKALGNKKAIGETINICTGTGYTTKETADIIAKLTYFKGEVHWKSTPSRPLDAKVLIGDNKKAKKLIGWEPKYTLEEGLKRTVEHWRQKTSA